jgi:hypothetical protein
MKTISADKNYIDYVSGDSGVRVWKRYFQELYRKPPHSDWQTVDPLYDIPTTEEQISWKFVALAAGTPPPQTLRIAMAVSRYEERERDPELRKLLMGWKPFKEAVSPL